MKSSRVTRLNIFVNFANGRLSSVIVVPGLGGHAFGSFKERAGEHMWVRDALPKALTGGNDYPIARIMTYGYKSTVQNSSSVEHIGDLAESFHSSLIELARVPEMKPLVFIGHSMGGLVIKEVNKINVLLPSKGNADAWDHQALIILSQSRIESASRLFRATRGLAFFGVPHAGMKVESIRAMAGNSPNLPLIDSLSGENSHFLTQQLPRFNKLLDSGNPKIETIYFYETLESPTAQKVWNAKVIAGVSSCRMTDDLAGCEWKMEDEWSRKAARLVALRVTAAV